MKQKLKKNTLYWLLILTLIVGMLFVFGTTAMATTSYVASVTDGGTTTNYENFNEAREAWNRAGKNSKLTLFVNVGVSEMHIQGEKILDLNGHELRRAEETGNHPVISIAAGNSLTLEDSGNSGKITGGKGTLVGSYDVGGGIIVNGGSFTMNGGTITGNEVHGTGGEGGGVWVGGNGTFTMNGGTISGNVSDSGGGVGIGLDGWKAQTGNCSPGTFIMNGGTITGNSGGTGNGIRLDCGTLKTYGGSVTGNSGTNGDIDLEINQGDGLNKFYIKGNVTIGKVYLEDTRIINIDDSISSSTVIKVKVKDNPTLPHIFTSGLSGKGSISNFTSYDPAYKVAQINGEAALVSNESRYVFFESNGGSGSMNSQHVTGTTTNLTENSYIRDGYSFTGWNTEADGAGDSYADKATISGLTDDLTLYAQWKLNPGSYMLVSVKNGEHTIGSETDTVFTFKRSVNDEVTRDQFVTAYMDGKEIPESGRAAAKGSLILTLGSSYLDTLTPGDHKLTASFKDGTADAPLKIIAAASAPTSASASGSAPAPTSIPRTGDGANLGLWIGMAVLGIIGIIAFTGKKSRKHRE